MLMLRRKLTKQEHVQKSNEKHQSNKVFENIQ